MNTALQTKNFIQRDQSLLRRMPSQIGLFLILTTTAQRTLRRLCTIMFLGTLAS